MRTPGLFDAAPRFDGPVYDPALDHDRLRRQHGRVFDLHLRKPRFGGCVLLVSSEGAR